MVSRLIIDIQSRNLIVPSVNNSVVKNFLGIGAPTNGGPRPETVGAGSQLSVAVYHSAVHRDVRRQYSIQAISPLIVYLVCKPVELAGVFNGVIIPIFWQQFRMMTLTYLLCRLIAVAAGAEAFIVVVMRCR